MKPLVVHNPRAGGGRNGRQWAEIAPRIVDAIGPFEEARTRAPRDATALVREAVAAGHRLIVAVGGDGTISEAVDGLFGPDSRSPSDVVFGFVQNGTGNDFRRNFGIGPGLDAGIAALKSGGTRRIDIGRLTFVRHDGSEGVQHFCNIASFGLPGATDLAVHTATTSRLLGPKLFFVYQVFAALVRYRFQKVLIEIDGTALEPTVISTVAVSNGQSFGGGMLVAPNADPADGLFDVVVMKGTTKREIVANIHLIYSGRHLAIPSVSVHRGRRIRALPLDETATGPVLLDVEGEAPGRLPATFEVVAGALTVRCPSG